MDDAQEARPANYLEVGFNLAEFILVFGQAYEGQGDAFLHTRLVTSPIYAKQFSDLLARSLAEYEMEYGRIGREPD